MNEYEFRAFAYMIIRGYVTEHLDKSDGAVPDFDIYVVWECKTLQNNKALLSTTLRDGMYYELTYNGDEGEFYLDAYKKFENRRISLSELEKELV